jgi:hypothetical protein
MAVSSPRLPKFVSVAKIEPNHQKRLQDILTEMHALLVKYDYGQQSYTSGAIVAVDSGDPGAILDSFNSLEFWGGAGSIADLILFELPWSPGFRRAVQDDDRLRALRWELWREMERLPKP